MEWWKRSTIIPLSRSPLYDPYDANQSPVSNHPPALGRAVVRLAGHGTKLIAQFLDHEPSPQQMVTFERELCGLLREVGRRIVAWVLNHVEPECPEDAPARLWWKGQTYRRRRKHRTTIATLFGPVVIWRRLYEPLTPGRRALYPWSLPWV
jgi:hypothetical protein